MSLYNRSKHPDLQFRTNMVCMAFLGIWVGNTLVLHPSVQFVWIPHLFINRTWNCSSTYPFINRTWLCVAITFWRPGFLINVFNMMSSLSFLNSCHTQYYVVLKQIFTTNNMKMRIFHYKNCVQKSTMFCFNICNTSYRVNYLNRYYN